MARSWFGGGVEDWSLDYATGRGLGGAIITFWADEAMSTAYTDLLNASSAPITSVQANADGSWPSFQGPDEVTFMWASANGSAARIIEPHFASSGGGGGTPGPPGLPPGTGDRDIVLYDATNVALQAQSGTALTPSGPFRFADEPFYDVMAYGADPSGVANSTTAFHTMRDQVGDFTRYVGPGTYKVTLALNVDSQHWVFHPLAVLVPASAATLVAITAPGVILEGGTFDGVLVATTGIAVSATGAILRGVKVVNIAGNGISSTSGTTTIRDAIVADTTAVGIISSGSGTVLDVAFTEAYGSSSGIGGGSGDGILVWSGATLRLGPGCNLHDNWRSGLWLAASASGRHVIADVECSRNGNVGSLNVNAIGAMIAASNVVAGTITCDDNGGWGVSFGLAGSTSNGGGSNVNVGTVIATNQGVTSGNPSSNGVQFFGSTETKVGQIIARANRGYDVSVSKSQAGVTSDVDIGEVDGSNTQDPCVSVNGGTCRIGNVIARGTGSIAVVVGEADTGNQCDDVKIGKIFAEACAYGVLRVELAKRCVVGEIEAANCYTTNGSHPALIEYYDSANCADSEIGRVTVRWNGSATLPVNVIKAGVNSTGHLIHGIVAKSSAYSGTAIVDSGTGNKFPTPPADGTPGYRLGTLVLGGELTIPDLSVSGLTGATTASRHVGGTAATAPTAGTFAVGDLVTTQTGRIFICTTTGTPGTWTEVTSLSLPKSGGTMTGELVVPDLSVSGLAGATTASRHVGATSGGPPASGAFVAGDHITDANGVLWFCTTGGTPGTWKPNLPASEEALRYSQATLTGSPIVRSNLPRMFTDSNLAAAISSGVMTIVTIPFFQGDVIAGVRFYTGTTAVTWGSNADAHMWAAIYDPSSTAASLAQSTDDTSKPAIVAASHKQLAFSYTITRSGLYYVAIMLNVGTGGSPAICSLRGIVFTSASISAGAETSMLRAGNTAGSGLTTAASAPLGVLTRSDQIPLITVACTNTMP